MSSTYSKVKTIAEDTGLKQTDVAKVLYSYASWCMEEVLLDGSSNTIFGKLTLDEKTERLHLDTNKFGLIDILQKSDIKLMQKIVENGTSTRIFE